MIEVERVSPRSAEVNEHLREQSREKILAAALAVFAEKGYHNATISEITARAASREASSPTTSPASSWRTRC